MAQIQNEDNPIVGPVDRTFVDRDKCRQVICRQGLLSTNVDKLFVDLDNVDKFEKNLDYVRS